jgi:hypothetical protein
MLRELLKEGFFFFFFFFFYCYMANRSSIHIGDRKCCFVKSWPAIAFHLSTLQIYLTKKKKKGKRFSKISIIQDKYVLMDEFQLQKCR